MAYFPLFIDLNDKDILVIGGGQVAYRKIKALRDFGGNVTVIAPTICDDIAKKLGTIGYMKELNRLKVGKFNIEQAITLEEIENNKDNIQSKVITMEKFFKELPKIDLRVCLPKRRAT